MNWRTELPQRADRLRAFLQARTGSRGGLPNATYPPGQISTAWRPRASSVPVSDNKRQRLEASPQTAAVGSNPGMDQERAVLSATVHPNPNHPITQLAQDLLLEREQCSIPQVCDHGTWSGSWAMPSRTEFQHFQGVTSISHSHDCELTALLAQKAGRKEMNWRNMSPQDQVQFQAALDKHWKISSGHAWST